jgi:hypothetical protein
MQRADLPRILREARTRREEARSAQDARVREGRSLYQDANGQALLLPSFVVYLDELGTSARLPTMTNEDLRDDLDAYDSLRSFLHDEATGWDEESQRALYFSDNVVLVAPCNPHLNSYDLGLFYKVFSAGCYQLNMAVRGRFLRGGITVGDAYADHSFVTGPAHLAAVIIEEKEAVTGRVLLDESCVELARTEMANSGYPDPNDSAFAAFLIVDEDRRTFVNYLAATAEDEWARPGVTEAGLIRHRDRLVAALAAHAADPKVLAKYEWTAAYHNFICSDFFDREDLRISGVPSVAFSRFT